MDQSLERPHSVDIIQGGFSTPCDSPLRPQFPNGDASAFLRFYDVEIFSVTWETSPYAIDRVVPEPLARREGSNDHVIAHLISYPDSEWFGAFTETIFTVGCVTTDPGTPDFVPQQGAFVPYCFTSSEAKLSLGREVYGLPYKFAETRIEKKGDLLVGSVERNGITILRATMPHKQAVTTPRGFDNFFEWRRLVALKTIDAPDGTSAIRQLTTCPYFQRTDGETALIEGWGNRIVSLEFGKSTQAPIYRLPPVELGDISQAYSSGVYWRATFDMQVGEVLYDYPSRPFGEFAPNAKAAGMTRIR